LNPQPSKVNQFVARLWEIFVEGLVEVPSLVQQLLHSQDFWKLSSVILTDEPMTFKT